MPNVRGELSAEFALVNGRTQLARRYHTAPLKIAKAFRMGGSNDRAGTDAGDPLGVYVMDCSPGLMSGDRYRFDLMLGGRTNVYWTNQSFTKVHPSLGLPSTQLQHIVLDEGAVLEWIPEPVMLYAGASLDMDTEVRMGRGSTLFLAEVLCPGRTHRGEAFDYERYAGRLSIEYDGELVYANRLVIEPKRMAVSSLAAWSGHTHMAAFVAISDAINNTHVQQLRDILEASQLYAGVSLTHRCGLVITMLGRSAWQLQHGIDLIWGALRGALLGLQPLPIRK